MELCFGDSGLLTYLYGIMSFPFCSPGLAMVLSNQLDQLSKRGHNLKLTLDSGCFTGLRENSSPLIWHLSFLKVTHICVCLKETWLAVLPLLTKEGVMLCLQNCGRSGINFTLEFRFSVEAENSIYWARFSSCFFFPLSFVKEKRKCTLLKKIKNGLFATIDSEYKPVQFLFSPLMHLSRFRLPNV